MFSTFALLSNLLLASVTLAVPGFLPEPSNDVQTPSVEKLTNSTHYNPSRAGVFLTKDRGTFHSVDAQFIVPHPPGKNGSMSIWVGIDGSSCNSTTLATGIDIDVVSGKTSYATWAIWYPSPTHHFDNFDIHAGDTIHFHINATSPTSAVSRIVNKRTGQSVIRNYASEKPLCENNVQWYVEDYSTNGTTTLVPFLDFGTVNFTEARAYGPHGTYGPSSSGATVAAIEQKNKVLTRTTIQKDKILVKHL